MTHSSLAGISIVLLAATFPIFSGCSQIEETRQEQVIRNVVIRYNSLLIEVNKSRDVTPLKTIADEPVVKRLYWWMAAWEDGNVYLDAELGELDFVSIKISGDHAIVTTDENWSYIYRDLDTQEIAEPRQFISYEMEYVLEKREKNWLITGINILKETEGHSDKLLPPAAKDR